ncbi:hypothetical protein FRC11_011670, partial [Ceratobasidium sp. 423]
MPPRRPRGRRNSVDDDDDDYSEEEPQLKRIDTELPGIILHDLGEWNERFDNLQDGEGNGTRKADTFAITGVYVQGQERYRAGIDFERHRITRDSGIDLIESCDIDSVIAVILGDLPISPRANFCYFMLADPTFTLTENLHIPPIDLIREPGRVAEKVKVHHIPNARFGKMGRFLILIFFPALYDDEDRNESESPNVVTDEYMALFYNLAVRVATNNVIPEDLRNQWAAAYDDELFRTGPLRNPNDLDERRQRLARLARLHTERIVHGHLFNRWLQEIKRLCAALPELAFARGFFLLIDGKGFKENNLSSHHAPVHPLVDDDPQNSRTAAIEAVFADTFVPAEFADGEWYLDIATNISGRIGGDENGRSVSLFINSDLHPEIINHFSEVPLDTCSRSVRRRSDGYAKDTVAHIPNFAGLRKDFDPPEGNGIVKLQAYTSDKSVTYRPDLKRKAIRTSPNMGFKWRRLNAIWNVLEQICAADKARSKFSLDQLSEVGSLVILLTYMANALINRPDDGGHFDEVHDSGCIHEIINYELVPVIQLGYYIIHSLRLPRIQETDFKLPRISSQRTISRRTIIYLLATEKSERNELHVFRLFRNERKRPADDTDGGDAWGIAPPRQRITYPHTSNKQRVTLSLPDPVPDILADRLPDEELRVVYSSEEEDNEARERAPKLSIQVATLIHTYPLQIIAKIPNRKYGRGSWSRLTFDQRSKADFALFCDATAPARIFISWNNFGRDGTRWDSTLAALFPTREEHEKMGKTQNLSQMSVWHDWHTALMRLSLAGQKKTVREARAYVSQNWKWLPYYTKKKLWVTGESPTITIVRQ